MSSQPQNPRKHCNAIVTKNGKHLGEPIGKTVNEADEEGKEKEVQKLGEEDLLKKMFDKSVQKATEKKVFSKNYATH